MSDKSDYIVALSDISTDLMEALQDSGRDGEIAVAIVDIYGEVVHLRKISYDAENKCIVIQLGYSSTDSLRGFSQEIAKVNREQ